MEFTLSKKDLVKALARVQNVVDRKGTQAILSNVLISAEGAATLRFAGSDGVISVESRIPANIKQPGSVVLPARAFFDVARTLPEGEVSFVVGANFSARVQSGRRKFELAGQRADEYPPLPSPGNAELREFPVDVLSTLISLTRFSMSTDEARAHLAGALLEHDGAKVRMVTTDGHRLSLAERKLETAGTRTGPMSLLVPAKGIVEISRILDEVRGDTKGAEGGPGHVALGPAGNSMFVRRDGTTLAVKLVDAAFPAYQQVIPQSSSRTVRISRAALLDALRAVSLVASERLQGVRLAFSGSTLVVSSENPDVGSGSDELEVELKGQDLTIGFNSKYVIDVLSALTSEDVVLELSGDLDPGVVRAADDDTYLGVIMPMRI